MRWCNPGLCHSLPNVASTASSPISLTPVCVCQVKGSTLKVEGQLSSLDARLHQLQSMMHQDVRQLSDTITKGQMAASNRIRCVHPDSSTHTEQSAASVKLGADGVGRRVRSQAEANCTSQCRCGAGAEVSQQLRHVPTYCPQPCTDSGPVLV